MPLFEYKAIKDNGQPVTGTLEAAYAGAVFEYLEKQNFVPVKISVKKQAVSFNLPFLKKRTRVKEDEILNFTKQLVVLLKAGVPIISSIEALRDQTDNKDFRGVLQQIHDDVESGSNFSDSLKKHPNIFSGLYVNSVKAGEAGGVLDQVLERIGLLMAYEADIRQKVKGAIRYPIFVISGIFAAFFFLMTFVVPNFIDMFASQEAELPIITQILILVS
ncbi:type II secretion system F family protein, partial [candidate division KSB1 bacterium]